MTQKENASQRLSYFSSLYEKSKNAAQSALALYDRHMRQYRGSAESQSNCLSFSNSFL